MSTFSFTLLVYNRDLHDAANAAPCKNVSSRILRGEQIEMEYLTEANHTVKRPFDIMSERLKFISLICYLHPQSLLHNTHAALQSIL